MSHILSYIYPPYHRPPLISKFITFICSYFELSCMQSPWVFCDTDDITNYINWQNIQSKCYMLVGVGDLLKAGLAHAWLCSAGGWAIIFYRFVKLAAACVRDKQFVLKKSPCSSHMQSVSIVCHLFQTFLFTCMVLSILFFSENFRTLTPIQPICIDIYSLQYLFFIITF